MPGAPAAREGRGRPSCSVPAYAGGMAEAAVTHVIVAQP